MCVEDAVMSNKSRMEAWSLDGFNTNKAVASSSSRAAFSMAGQGSTSQGGRSRSHPPPANKQRQGACMRRLTQSRLTHSLRDGLC